MIDDLARRLVANQIGGEAAAVVRDAEQLAQAYTQFAQDVANGRTLNGEAHRLTQAATEILRRTARLDGLREIAQVAGLMEDQTSPAADPTTEK